MCYLSLDHESTTQTQIQLGLVWIIGPEPQLRVGSGSGSGPFYCHGPNSNKLKKKNAQQ